MPENDATADAGEQNQDKNTFKAPESQEELDRIIQKRIERVKSSYQDYDDLREKAARLDELEESKKSELEKANHRAEQLEQELEQARIQVVRSDVAQAKGVPASLLSGSTQEELEASADALLEFRGEVKQSPQSSAFKDVSGEPVKGDTSTQFADFFNKRS